MGGWGERERGQSGRCFDMNTEPTNIVVAYGQRAILLLDMWQEAMVLLPMRGKKREKESRKFSQNEDRTKQDCSYGVGSSRRQERDRSGESQTEKYCSYECGKSEREGEQEKRIRYPRKDLEGRNTALAYMGDMESEGGELSSDEVEERNRTSFHMIV
jgi:hypothetical protein